MTRQIRTVETLAAHREKMDRKRHARSLKGRRNMSYVAPKEWVRVTPCSA
ncbi:MAG TPA: hypothetical protein VGV37_06200 [Aliidongia sp.]|nr:hypothetical protein [Aliidongia sp.]HEV2674116.1 hypothetical protein [Aliidongia sp.]